MLGLLTHRSCHIINWCCFRLLACSNLLYRLGKLIRHWSKLSLGQADKPHLYWTRSHWRITYFIRVSILHLSYRKKKTLTFRKECLVLVSVLFSLLWLISHNKVQGNFVIFIQKAYEPHSKNTILGSYLWYEIGRITNPSSVLTSMSHIIFFPI